MNSSHIGRRPRHRSDTALGAARGNIAVANTEAAVVAADAGTVAGAGTDAAAAANNAVHAARSAAEAAAVANLIGPRTILTGAVAVESLVLTAADAAAGLVNQLEALCRQPRQ